MKENNSIISKGTYDYYQQGAFVHLKNYIITTIDGKKCLLLNFFNDSSVIVDRIKFKLTQFDSSGKILSSKSFAYESLRIPPGKEFALKSGILINENLADFKIIMEFVTTGLYKFVFTNGLAVQKYDPRGYKINAKNKQKGTLKVTRVKNSKNVKPKRLPFFLFLFFVFALIIINLYNSSLFGKKVEELQFNNYYSAQIETINEYEF